MIRDVRTQNSYESISNRIFNIAGAAVLLLLLGPLLVLVALGIRCDSSGPAFERRLSRNREGEPFYELNFRVTGHDNSGLAWPKDITRVGWFLLYTRIVSLPQLINVARGDIMLADMHDGSAS